MAEENEEELYSEDPEEQLKIENDILKLKLQAELGGDYESEGELPPEIENIFLKNVIEFEHQFANADTITLYDRLGQPPYVKADIIPDNELEEALQNIEVLMEEKGIEVDYAEPYTTRLKYTFITEELFLKTSPFFQVQGMVMHYIYEEFHPNHRLDIKGNAEKFCNNWIEQNFNEYSWELSNEITINDDPAITRVVLLAKIQNIFESYTSFDNCDFRIDNIYFEINESGESRDGKGFAKGNVSYDAVLESGDTQHFDGGFTFNMTYDSYWSIVNFEWPGFRY